MKSLTRSWSATPQSKKIIDDMRAHDKKRVYALVRQCRVRSNANEIGLADLQSRKQAVLESAQSITHAFGVHDMSAILRLTRQRFIARHVYVEGIAGAPLQDKEEAAVAKWTRDLANPDIQSLDVKHMM